MDPSLRPVWENFSEERNRDLYQRLKGWYRAVVVETNDPLRIGRVRFKMPEIHNVDLDPEQCPWAVPAFGLGGKRSGQWFSAIIGDIVWVTFEKQHLYGPIWAGGADPTRRKFYPLPSLSGETPQAVNTKGEPADSPDDYDKKYHPKDNRPMSFGVQDRYGNADVFSAVGYFPKEHERDPAEAGSDGVTRQVFSNASGDKPESNKPDVKYIARITKYGTYTVHSDIGYDWKKDGSQGEFEGDFDNDEDFEIERWKYFLKLLNEEEPEGFDQRRYEVRTRYGHKLEAREVGWEKSRAKEYDDSQRTIADSKGRDERWWKMRTKGGHFIQMIDTGNDPEQDLFVKRLLKSEVGTKTEEEDSLGRDQRMIRMQSRYGLKTIIDDRGSDSKDADNKEEPRGNGVMTKGRRDNRGFCYGFNEKDEVNAFFLLSPKGQAFEQNDRFEFLAMCTAMSEPTTETREGHYGVEWPTISMLGRDFERNTYHMKLDKKNKYARMKTPTGQGVEFRDPGGEGECTEWAEIRDHEDRGMWWNPKGGYTIWRSKESAQYMVLHDKEDYILIKNTKDGPIQIITQGDVEVKAEKSIKLQAGKKISMKADTEICMEVSGNQAVLNSSQLGTQKRLDCQTMAGYHEGIIFEPGPAKAPPSPAGCGADTVTPKDVEKKKPEEEDKERACAPNKKNAGPVPKQNFGGGGGPGGNTPGSPTTPPDDTPPPAPSPDVPEDPSAEPPPDYEPPEPDPLPNGCLWYGISDVWRAEIEEKGLLIDSYANLQNNPDDGNDPTAERFIFTGLADRARGEEFAKLSQERYGGFSMILKILVVDDPDILTQLEEDDELWEYLGDEIKPEHIEVYEIGDELLTS